MMAQAGQRRAPRRAGSGLVDLVGEEAVAPGLEELGVEVVWLAVGAW